MSKVYRNTAVLFAILIATTALAIDFPKPVGFVNDYVGMLTSDQKQSLENKLKALFQKDGSEIAVAIVPSLEGLVVEDYSIQLFKAWHIGRAGKNNGVLLLFAPNEKKVRIETGYGAEGLIPDVAAKAIINNEIVPKYRLGDKFGAVSAGVDAIIAQLTEETAPGESEKVKPTSMLFVVSLVLGASLVIMLLVIVVIVRTENRRHLRRWQRKEREEYIPYAPSSNKSRSESSTDSDSGFTAGVIAGSILGSNDDDDSSSGGSSGGGFDGFGGGDAGGGGASGDL